MSDLTSKQKAERLRELRVLLKSGEYDGADLMAAWIALEEYADLLERPQEATGLKDYELPCLQCGKTGLHEHPHEPEGVDLCPSGRRWCKGPNGNGRRCHACEADRTTQTKGETP